MSRLTRYVMLGLASLDDRIHGGTSFNFVNEGLKMSRLTRYVMLGLASLDDRIHGGTSFNFVNEGLMLFRKVGSTWLVGRLVNCIKLGRCHCCLRWY